jgi:hypothetical protein
LESGKKAWAVVLWTLPYVLMLTTGLVLLSFAVQFFNPLPLWVYVLSIGMGLAYLFFFLARLHQAGVEAGSRTQADE